MDKILKIQTEIGKLQKDNAVSYGTTKYKFFDINQLIEKLLPLLEKYEITVMQPLSNINGKPAIKTLLYLSGEDYKDIGWTPIIEDITPLPENTDPQKMGSAITYFRRYALQSLFLLQAEDDDGNHASAKTKKSTYETYKNVVVDEDSDTDLPF